MKRVLLLGFMLVLCFGQSDEYKAFAKKIKYEIERAHYSGDTKSYKELVSKTQRLIQFDTNIWYGHYYNAFVLNDLGNIFLNSDEDKAAEYYDSALESLEKCEKLIDSEYVYVLMSDILGKKIKISPIKGMFLGPKAGSYIEKAYNKSPENPSVLIGYGVSKMHTPSMFGGDKELSRKVLNKAIQLNETYELNDDLILDCRKADAYLWLSQLDNMEEKNESAIKNIENALAIESEYKYAQILKKLYSKK